MRKVYDLGTFFICYLHYILLTYLMMKSRAYLYLYTNVIFPDECRLLGHVVGYGPARTGRTEVHQR